MRFTLALPALPTSRSTWPISRLSAPATGANIVPGHRDAAVRRTPFRVAAFFAALRGAAFFAARLATGRRLRDARVEAFSERRAAGNALRFLAITPR